MPHKLLLADDSVTIQRVIELTFAEEDIQVIAVSDGKQAIHRVQQDPPDIILADVGMPERDGYEVAMFVKQTPELQHIPVLLLTGAFEPIDEARARGGVRRRARQTLRTAACDQQGQGSDPRATFSATRRRSRRGPPGNLRRHQHLREPRRPVRHRRVPSRITSTGSTRRFHRSTPARSWEAQARRRGNPRTAPAMPASLHLATLAIRLRTGTRTWEGCLGGEDHHAAARPWLDAGAPRRSAGCAARTTVSCPCRDRRAAGSGAGR